MRKISKFKGEHLQISSIRFHIPGGVPVLDVEAALVSMEDDNAIIVGHTRSTSWSEETREKLDGFLKQLEKDMCSQIGEGSHATRTGILDSLRED